MKDELPSGSSQASGGLWTDTSEVQRWGGKDGPGAGRREAWSGRGMPLSGTGNFCLRGPLPQLKEILKITFYDYIGAEVNILLLYTKMFSSTCKLIFSF